MDSKYCKHCNADFRLEEDHWIKSTSSNRIQYICKQYRRNYYKTVKDQRQEYAHKYYNTEDQKNKKKLYQIKHKEDISNCKREYKNKDIIRKKKTIYHKEKLKSDSYYKFKHNLRRRVSLALTKNYSTEKLLGSNFKQVWEYLLSTTSIDIKIEKYHIDHIIPLSLFDLTIEEHQLAANYYKNLRIISVEENLKKSNKWDNSIPDWMNNFPKVKTFLEDF